MFILGFLSRYVNRHKLIHFLRAWANTFYSLPNSKSYFCLQSKMHLYVEKQVINLKICVLACQMLAVPAQIFPLSVYKLLLYDISLNKSILSILIVGLGIMLIKRYQINDCIYLGIMLTSRSWIVIEKRVQYISPLYRSSSYF